MARHHNYCRLYGELWWLVRAEHSHGVNAGTCLRKAGECGKRGSGGASAETISPRIKRVSLFPVTFKRPIHKVCSSVPVFVAAFGKHG